MPSTHDVSLNTRAPDAPFRLKLLTAVQPHKQMASKMAVTKKAEEGGEEDGVEEEEEGIGGDVTAKKTAERPRQQKKAKKAKKAVELEEVAEEEMEDAENAEDALPDMKKAAKSKSGDKAKGARAKPLGRTQMKA